MINRAAVILKYKAPFIQWVNEADPYPKVDTILWSDKAYAIISSSIDSIKIC